MEKEIPEQPPPAADAAATFEAPEPPAPRMEGELAPDLEVEPEHSVEDQEDVERMWEASDPLEGEAPTG